MQTDSHTKKPPRRKCITPGTAGLSAEGQLSLFFAADALEDACELVAEGRPVAAREEIEEALSIIRAAGRGEGEENTNLEGLPPVWRIDAELHRRRKGALLHYMPDGFFDEDGSFIDSDPERHHMIKVQPNDNWRATSGVRGYHMSGRGLTELIAYLNGKGLAGTVLEMAQKYGIGGPNND